MLFIWRGDGALVPVTVIVVGIVMEILAVIAVGAAQSSAHTNTLIALILAVSAGVVWLIARRVRDRPGRTTTDRKTGAVTQYIRRDEFFFIALDRWPLVLLVGAAVFVVVGAIRGGL